MDGAHHHHGNGGGIPPEALMILAVVAGIAIIGPIVLAILQAIITILLICIGVACVGIATFLCLRVRGSHRDGTLPWQQRGYGVIQPPAKPREITASTPDILGHIILTAEEYEEIRRNRYDK